MSKAAVERPMIGAVMPRRSNSAREDNGPLCREAHAPTWLSRDLATSDVLPHATLALSPTIALALVAGGMAVGLAGSLMSLSRLEV